MFKLILNKLRKFIINTILDDLNNHDVIYTKIERISPSQTQDFRD